MADQEACLGAAILDDLPNAPDTATPSAWRQIFHAEHTAAPLFSGFFTACQSGRDWALRTALQLTITLSPPTTSKGLAAWETRLREVRRALSTRGPRSTGISVSSTSASGPPLPVAYWMLADSLKGVAEGVTSLFVGTAHDTSPASSAAVADILRELAAVLPQLEGLAVNCPAALPPHHVIPHLAQLTIKSALKNHNPSLYSSIAPYLPQLTRLDLGKDQPYDGIPIPMPWAFLFQTTTRTLTSFSASVQLQDSLIGLLLDYAPALTELYVGSIRGCLGVHGNRQ